MSMNSIRLALLAVAAISPAALLAQDLAVSPGPEPQAETEPVTRQQISAEMAREFDKHDTDHDGFMSWEEWVASNIGDPLYETNGRVVFDHMDTDRDHRLARQEVIAWSMRVFDCLDENRDGSIANAEAKKNIERCMKSEAGISGLPPARPAGYTPSSE